MKRVCLSSLRCMSGNSLFGSLLEPGPVIMNIALAVGLGVDEDTTLLRGCLLVEEDLHFETTRDTGVAAELKSELLGVFCLHAISDRGGILIVASAATIVNNDVVRRRLVAAHFLRWTRTHLLFTYILIIIENRETKGVSLSFSCLKNHA